MFFCSVNHRKQHLLSRLFPQGSMFDKNDARVEQERAEAEEKRQRRRRCHSLHWPTWGLDQQLDQQTKSGKLGKLGKCSEINIKLRIINWSSKNGHGVSPGFGMVTEFLAARIIKNCEKIFETMAKADGVWLWLQDQFVSLSRLYIYINGSRYEKIIYIYII